MCRRGGLWARMQEGHWLLALPLTLAMHLGLVYFAFPGFSLLTSKSNRWSDSHSLTVPRPIPLWSVLFLRSFSAWGAEDTDQGQAPVSERGCRCVSLNANVPSLMGWHQRQASLRGKKFPSNYTAVLWWLRAIMGMLFAAKALSFINSTVPLSNFFSLLDRSVFCGSPYHSHASKCE